MNKFKTALLMFVIIPALLLISGAVGVNDASACSCAMFGSPEEELGRVSAVFSGRAKSVTAENERVFTSADAILVTFEVNKVWKGDFEAGEVTVTTARDGAMCGYSFVEGESYLVYASGEDSLNVSLCSRTAVLGQASEDLQYLNSLDSVEEEPVNIENKPVEDASSTPTTEDPSSINNGAPTSTERTVGEEGRVSGSNYLALGLFLVAVTVFLGAYLLIRQR